MIESPARALSIAGPITLLSNKVRNFHFERLAIVYVRQSSTKQVEENIESTQMQYQLVDRAAALGWPRQRIEVIGQSERVAVSIRWAGGFEREHEIRRAVGRFEQLESAGEIRSRIVALKQQGQTHEAVARQLNAEKFHSTSGDAFTAPIISQLCRKFRAEGHVKDDGVAPSSHWKLGALAKELGILSATLSTWRRRGWIHADRRNGRWILWADAKELHRLRRLADYDRIGLQPTPSHLTKPKVR
jgi:hypothetical protein